MTGAVTEPLYEWGAVAFGVPVQGRTAARGSAIADAIAAPTAYDAACKRVAYCYLLDMGQPVKLSDSLVLDARMIGEVAERSIAGQIEFWAGLGRAIEPVLRSDTALALKRRGEAVPLSKCIASVGTKAGRAKIAAVLGARPFPHFEAAAAPGLIVKIDADGTRTTGRFVNREFRAVSAP